MDHHLLHTIVRMFPLVSHTFGIKGYCFETNNLQSFHFMQEYFKHAGWLCCVKGRFIFIMSDQLFCYWLCNDGEEVYELSVTFIVEDQLLDICVLKF